MTFAIVNTANADTWITTMQRVGARSIYYLPEYHKLYDFAGGRALAYIVTVCGETLFYPFILRPICRVGSVATAEGLNDIETVYGYTGPVATSVSPDFLAEAWREFESWCSEQNVVCEFIRFNPLLRAERFAAPQTDVVYDRETVEIRLDNSEDHLWGSYEKAKRRKVRRAIASGLTCEEVHLEEGLPPFRDLYEDTMRRVRGLGFYFFPGSYYSAIQHTLADYSRVFVVKQGSNPVAAGLCFTYEDTVCTHLSGSVPAAHSLAPNELMIHEIALWSQRRGFKRFYLGGGRTNSENDSLFQFKKQFASRLVPFYIGKRIHHPGRYEMLTRLWMEQSAIREPPSYFRLYRLDPGGFQGEAQRG